MSETWYRRPQILIAAGVFVLTLGVYILTLNPTTPFWDAGEFITTSHIVGVPHQPGTPMYVLVGRVFDIVFGNADITQASYRTAWAVNFMSAFFSSLAVMFVYLLIWELGRRADPDSKWIPHVGGVVGALFLAFSETFWNNAIEAEVYGLSAFILALLSWLSIRWYEHRQDPGSNQLLILMIYLLGLGVGFHLGSVLVYPGVFLLVWLSAKRVLPVFDLFLMSAGLAVFLFSTTTRDNGTVIMLLAIYLIVVAARSFQGKHFALVGSALFFIGLTVHAMMLVRAGASPEPFINQTDPDNFSSLMSVIRREQYPPLNPFQRQAPLAWQYGYFYNYLFKQFYFLGPGHGAMTTISTVLGPIFLALLGLFQGLRRIRPLIYVPLANYLFNGEILTLYLNFTDHEVRDRDYFYFAAFMFVAVFIGLGASALLRYACGGEGETSETAMAKGIDWRRDIPGVKIGLPVKIGAAVMLLMAVFPLTPGHTKYFEHNNSENRIAYEYAWNIMAGLDENAILFTNGDNDTFPIWYLQEVEKFRTDITVVNLSLVNLPWYIKQLKNSPTKPLDMERTEQQIDELRHRVFEDPKTGERTYIMIKDYVVHDIITRNLKEAKRPVFFAVTIPHENMSRYFANLQMEGMAYRLTDTAGPDDSPVIDPDRVMENMLGVYRLGSLMSGDNDLRKRTYLEITGLNSDPSETTLGRMSDGMSPAQFDTLTRLLGEERTDIFRNRNATHLLGNYPTALNRAGHDYYLKASAVATTDTVEYRRLLNNSLVAFEASLRIAPFNEMAIEYYPLLLVQAYRDDKAKEFLSSLAGNVPQELEERLVYRTLTGIVRGGVVDLALDWIAERVAAEPERKFYYDMQFTLFQALGRLADAQGVADAWAARNGGQQDPGMARGLEEMRKRLMELEQQDIEGAIGGTDGR